MFLGVPAGLNARNAQKRNQKGCNPVIDRCFNPACRRNLLYLQDGRVVRIMRGKADNTSVEHYWLCGPCYATHDFEFPADGPVTIRERLGGDRRNDFYFHDIVLPERRETKRDPDEKDFRPKPEDP